MGLQDSILAKAVRITEIGVIDTPTLLAVRNGLLLTLPLVMAGSLALLINNFPLWSYQQAMLRLFGEGWKGWGETVWNGTFGILSLLMLYSISHQLTVHFNQKNQEAISPAIATLISLSALVSITPNTPNSLLPALWTGSGGLFVSILVALVSTKIFLNLMHLRFLHISFYAEGADIAIPQAFSCLLPGILTVLLFGLLNLLFVHMVGSDLQQTIYLLILHPFEFFQNTTGTSTAYLFLCQILWFFGIHGANVLNPVTHNFYEIAIQQNILAATAGEPIPHIMTKPFLDIFVYMGGAGSSVCLILAILIASKNGGSRKLAQFSSLPALFNINELILFGLPIILNPVFLIPFILTPMTLAFSSYIAISMGWVPPPLHTLDWTTPPLISGYIATDSIRAVWLQCFNIALGTLIYMPFVILSDDMKTQRHKKALKELTIIACRNTISSSGKKCLDRDDDAGALARALTNELEQVLRHKTDLFLEYQAQVDYRKNKVIGAEALIRWNSKAYGAIPPPVLISIAEDSGLIHTLGLWIIEEACIERQRWQQEGLDDTLKLSINLSVLQLTDQKLARKMGEFLEKYALKPSMIGIEITESVALDPDAEHNKLLYEVHSLGIPISIDDFGMGHSSLMYLKHFPVNALKIDKGLSKDVVHEKTCADIIATIVDLCTSLKIDVVVEYVENKEQVELLHKLGCHIFQGYYFSRPISNRDFIPYATAINNH